LTSFVGLFVYIITKLGLDPIREYRDAISDIAFFLHLKSNVIHSDIIGREEYSEELKICSMDARELASRIISIINRFPFYKLYASLGIVVDFKDAKIAYKELIYVSNYVIGRNKDYNMIDHTVSEITKKLKIITFSARKMLDDQILYLFYKKSDKKTATITSDIEGLSDFDINYIEKVCRQLDENGMLKVLSIKRFKKEEKMRISLKCKLTWRGYRYVQKNIKKGYWD